jgi:TonB-linked SusC/RagA family outer membrane protein
MKGDDYEKYHILSKVDVQAKSWLKIGLKGSFLSAKTGGVSPRIQNATWMSPYSYVYARQAGYENWYNSKPDGSTASPYWGSGANDSYLWTDNDQHNYNVNGVAYAQIDFPFVKGLTYRITLNGQRNTSSQDVFNNPSLWVDTNSTSQMDDPSQFNSSVSGYSVSSMTGTWNVDNILTYTKDIARHHVDAMLGYTREASNNEYLKTTFSGFTSPTTLGVYKQDLATTKTLSRTRTQSSSIAYLGRVNYNYDNKYYGTFNFRRDGYSAFAEGHKWGNFYGASAAWILSNESFVKDNTDLFDFLKLRLSWGQNGSRSVSPYATVASVSTIYTWFGDTTSGSTLGIYPTSLPNQGLTWATIEKLDLGVDFSILNNRLDGTIDIYKGNTKNMLMARSVPYPTGFTSAYDNVGKVTNKGIEISLNSTNINGDGNKNLRWTTNLTFDLNRNKIVSLYGKNYEGVESDDVANALAYGFDNYYAMVIGEAIGAAYDLKKLGVFQSQEEIDNYTWTDPKTGETKKIQPNAVPGDLKFQDYNNDGTIDANDRHYLGSMDPLFTVNLGNTLTWKNFSLYFNFRWMQGDDTHFLGFDPNAFGTSMTSGAQLDAIEPWTETNHTNKYPRYGYSNDLNYLYWNSRSFLKLKDLVFSYNINPTLLKKLDISNLRIYLAGTDLFTITKWSGLDPENGGTIASGASSSRYGSNGTYRTVSLGINLSF